MSEGKTRGFAGLGARLKELTALESTAPAPKAKEERPDDAPSLPELARLTEILDKESDALSAGDFEAFRRLQAEKRAAARAAERASKRAAAGALAEPQLAAFQQAAQRNERVLSGMKEAAARIKAYAIEAIEAQTGDGVYRRGGTARGLSSASVRGVQVKL